MAAEAPVDVDAIRGRVEYVRSMVAPMDMEGGFLDELSADVLALLADRDDLLALYQPALRAALDERAALEAERNEAVETRDGASSNIEGARALLDFVAEHPGTPLVVMAQTARERIVAAEERSRLQAEALSVYADPKMWRRDATTDDEWVFLAASDEDAPDIARAALAVSEARQETPVGWCHVVADHDAHAYTYMGREHWCRGKAPGAAVAPREPECPGPDCKLCSGEMCAQHGTAPCECDSAERHEAEPAVAPREEQPRDTILEMIGDAPVVFGLRAQGHLETIASMLEGDRSWEEIAATIGWDPGTAKRFYEMEFPAAPSETGGPENAEDWSNVTGFGQ